MSRLVLQKNLPGTKNLRSLFSKLRGHRLARILVTVFFFIGLWLLASYIFYLRFPNNYRQPNFFGEEGNVFANNIIHNGFLHALGTTFNGYYIWGIYVLEKIAFIINNLFYGGEFVNLPRSFALVSYGFLGFIATLPLLLFRRYFKLPALILATILILYVPLNGWDYGVIGTLGNTKFALIFVAFLLLIYRHYLPEKSKKIYLVDVVLLVCAYTDITVYVMMPFALLRYWPKLKGHDPWRKIKNVLRQDRSAQSLVVLGLAMLPQLYFMKHYGAPIIPGYLDSPYNFRSTIEIFISRSYLYEILFPINGSLNNATAVIAFIGILALGWQFCKKYRKIFIFGLLTIFFATFLFVVKRPGVSSFYIGYKDPGPAQFFFPQNWIFGFLVSVLLVEIISKIKSNFYQAGVYFAIIVSFFWLMAPSAGSYGRNDFMQEGVGDIYGVAKKECSSVTQDNNLSIAIYPTSDQHYGGLSRSQLCTTSVLNYQPKEVGLGISPDNSSVVGRLGTSNFIYQTFVSPRNNIDGLTVYFSTYLHHVKTPYNLTVFNKDCSTEIYSIPVPVKRLVDNTYQTVFFHALPSSQDQTYCFSIASTTTKNPSLLAIRLSASDAYRSGEAFVNGQPTGKDVVFKLHYKD